MVRSPHDEQWMKNYQLAKAFRETYGHLNVPKEYKNDIGFDLNEWFRKQLDANRMNTLSEECRRLLDEIGFDWLKPNERMWETRFLSARCKG